MDIWWLHALVFIFGYVTCKTFYFLNSARISLKLLKSGRVSYLLMCVKALEQYTIAGTLMKHHLDKIEADEDAKRSFSLRFDEDVQGFKRKAIDSAIAVTPPIFQQNLEFDDWVSAMVYLDSNRDEALEFWGPPR